MYARSPLNIYTGRDPEHYFNGSLDNISSANSSITNKQYHNPRGIYSHDLRPKMKEESDISKNSYGERYLETGKSSGGRTNYSCTVSETGSGVKRSRTYKRVAVRFAERTSLQGIPYINISKTWYAKAAWTLIFLSATGGMLYHLYFLFSIYLKFDVKTQVALGFDTLPFPAVTVCNVNPIMKRKLSITSQELRELVKQVDPREVTDLYKPPPPPPPPPQPMDGNKTAGNVPKIGIRQKRFLDKIPKRLRPPKRVETEQEYFDDNDWELVGDYDDADAIYMEFISLYNQFSRQKRFEIGHKMKDMLIKCSFSGRSCYAENFTRVADPHYGNCFTLESKFFKSRRSGPGNGLELLLFLENTEYIRGISNSNGAQIMVHDVGVLPQPYQDGFAVSGGDETYIGVKLVRISRMDSPFGFCNDTQHFKNRYGIKYSRSACQEICEAEATMRECECSDNMREETNMKIGKHRPIPHTCTTDDEVLCQFIMSKKFESNRLTCDCQDPCQEVKYVKSISSRQWPSDGYAEMLFQVLCHEVGEDECKEYEQSDKRTLSQNFVKVNIYFEDLNYQNITETQDYEFAQFISDVGGTLGLWIGISVLTVMEVIQFIVELFHHMCCVIPQRKSNMHKQKPYHK